MSNFVYKIKFENCYGIKKINHKFDFTNCRAVSLYAPNGTMKTSFAKTLRNYSLGLDSKDLMFPNRVSKVSIKDGDNNDVPKEEVFVIRPYVDKYTCEELSTLIVNEELKIEYNELREDVVKLKKTLIQKMKVAAGYPKGGKFNFEKEVVSLFDKEDFLLTIESLSERVTNGEYLSYSELNYNVLFSADAIKFLKEGTTKAKIQEYITLYESLLKGSSILKRGFNHFNAKSVSDSLKENGFFKAEHSVLLKHNNDQLPLSTSEELASLITEEQKKILKDENLQKKFESIEKKIKKGSLRELREYLSENKNVLSELDDIEYLRRKVIIGYLTKFKDDVIEIVDRFELNKSRMAEIAQRAKDDSRRWHRVVEIFNKRFKVPFRLSIENQQDVILNDIIPTITFQFNDNDDVRSASSKELGEVLSQGEKRALYLLDIIFEIEVRKFKQTKTLFIIDDIADSFDYKNKYAIVQYLRDLKDVDFFCQISLTHNFDFHRTISSRLGLWNSFKLRALKTDSEVLLLKETPKDDNPLKAWKEDTSCPLSFISLIPFSRNLSEYCGLDDEYDKLTALLHVKENSRDILISDLKQIYSTVLNIDCSNFTGNGTVFDLISSTASSLTTTSESTFLLEHKIVMSISIRLMAEDYMYRLISSKETVNYRKSGKTFGRFKELFPELISEIDILQDVIIMTPENIHLNSFMYEPLLDLSSFHLQDLYSRVSTLGES